MQEFPGGRMGSVGWSVGDEMRGNTLDRICRCFANEEILVVKRINEDAQGRVGMSAADDGRDGVNNQRAIGLVRIRERGMKKGKRRFTNVHEG